MKYFREFPGLMTAQPLRDRFTAGGMRFNCVTGAASAGFGFRLALARAAD
jgi:hypothetical protein